MDVWLGMCLYNTVCQSSVHYTTRVPFSVFRNVCGDRKHSSSKTATSGQGAFLKDVAAEVISIVSGLIQSHQVEASHLVCT